MQLREDVRTFLEEERFAVLATVNANGSPQQTVMWYELRGDTIVMNTKRGRKKDRNLIREPRASVCVEDGFRYVTLAGVIEFIEDPATAQADIAALARRYHDAETAEQMAREVFAPQERVTLLLHVDRADVHGFDDEE
ncbi:MAG TPA: PPOX class F420-dependent oxidoreductase [Thermomicrobiales bacterium]|nr:PPOX class F420-dependent oxidoreductase [Thermomicrobiales bacterium]